MVRNLNPEIVFVHHLCQRIAENVVAHQERLAVLSAEINDGDLAVAELG